MLIANDKRGKNRNDNANAQHVNKHGDEHSKNGL
jgi:hypothetical protein